MLLMKSKRTAEQNRNRNCFFEVTAHKLLNFSSLSADIFHKIEHNNHNKSIFCQTRIGRGRKCKSAKATASLEKEYKCGCVK